MEYQETGALARRALLRGTLAAAAAALLVPTAKAAGESEVSIDNFKFTPALLKVSKGSEVVWVNHDDIPHSIVLGALNVRSHAMDSDGTFRLKFDKPGTYSYVCGLHPHMNGKILVAG